MRCHFLLLFIAYSAFLPINSLFAQNVDELYQTKNLFHRCHISKSDVYKVSELINSGKYSVKKIESIDHEGLRSAMFLTAYNNHTSPLLNSDDYFYIINQFKIEELTSLLPFRKKIIDDISKSTQVEFRKLLNILINKKLSYSNKIDILYALNNFTPIMHDQVTYWLKDIMYYHAIQAKDLDFILTVYYSFITDDMLAYQSRHQLYIKNLPAAKKLYNLIKSDTLREQLYGNLIFYDKYIANNNNKKKPRAIPIELIGQDEYIDICLLQMLTNNSSLEARYNILKRENIAIDPETWFKYQKYFIREIVASNIGNRHNIAYNVITNNHNLTGEYYVSQNWLAGYISYLTKDYTKAAYHFHECADKAESYFDIARAYYWLGICLRHFPDKANESAQYFKNAANYYTTFYGQLAIEELGLDLKTEIQKAILHNEYIATNNNSACENPLFLASYLSYQFHSQEQYGYFTLFLMNNEIDIAQKVSAMGIARVDFDNHFYNRISANAVKENITLQDSLEIDHTLSSLHPLIKAIIKKESNFSNHAISYKGAMGMMQIMPFTAREVARKLGIKYDSHRMLHDTQYNLTLGHRYIEELLVRYNNHKILTLAAYNAGPGSVDKWIIQNGDPRNFNTNLQIAEWIEKIPFHQTRHYVLKILNMEAIYDVLGST